MDDKAPIYELALFAGSGGGILGGKLLGWTCVGAVEIEDFQRRNLMWRQRDGILPWFPIWDDVRTFRSDNPDCAEFFERLQSIRNRLVITGGFPCQDISAAGKGEGIEGERSGLWKEQARIISEIRPAFALMENSPLLVERGLALVLGDLAEMGYDARWGVFSAGDIAAPHRRERIFLLAHAAGLAIKTRVGSTERGESRSKPSLWGKDKTEHVEGYFNVRLQTESLRPGVANGVADWVDRLRAIGNGQVPAVVEFAWNTLIVDN